MELLIPVDVGNVNLKFDRASAGQWVVEPSLVATQATQGYVIGGGKATKNAPRPLRYVSGPARNHSDSMRSEVLAGSDAANFGSRSQSIIGEARTRVNTDPYLWLHLYTILQSLPAGLTEASILFAGGLPARDMDSVQTVQTALRQRLKGTHVIEWGSERYTITITGAMFVPQQIAALANFLYKADGQVQANTATLRKRFLLDIGGGTTEWTMRKGLEPIVGIEGGINEGMNSAARAALVAIQRQWPQLRDFTADRVLEMMRKNEKTLFVSGDPIDASEQLRAGMVETAGRIVDAALSSAGTQLSEADLWLAGGSAQQFAPYINTLIRSHDLKFQTMDNALFAIVEGIRRMALNAMLPRAKAAKV